MSEQTATIVRPEGEGPATPEGGSLFREEPAAKAPAKRRTTSRRRTTKRKAPAEPRTTTTRRTSLADGLGQLYGMLAGAVTMTYRLPVYEVQTIDGEEQLVQVGERPSLVGPIMSAQVPLAGKRLDQLAKEHPAADRMLAPIFGAVEFSILSELAAPPLIVWLVERRPEMWTMFRPVLMPMLRTMFVELVKAQKRDRETMADLVQAAGEQFDPGAFEAFLAGFGFTEDQVGADA